MAVDDTNQPAVMQLELETALTDAIAERRVVELRYEDGQSRVAHPHALYLTRDGEISVETYQVSGASSSGRLPGWRPFSLAKLRGVELLDERFEIAPGWNPSSPKYRHGLLAIVQP